MLGGLLLNRELSARMAALDALRTKVMIADADLNILYMNPAVIALMREAEPDLKKDLPRFSADSLIGSNIDVFHKNPGHQRKMLAALTKPHNATIRIGERAFDLLVTPILERQKRIGFVVEWSDAKQRLLNQDYAAQISAINRSQAVIEFTIDGTILTANENFLKAVGYAMDEIRGKHHGIFVQPALRQSSEYAAFWQRLRQGEFQAGQYKRIAKSGKEIWIEGAYNPILDSDGKVCRVVKFATDVTAQAELLANLKLLIDQNFGEIDSAINLSTTETRSAAAAVSETSANVQSMAASAEQMAASSGEISRSMNHSRLATESAFEQTSAAGKSTEMLAGAVRSMNGIANLIQSVASQINLLALNATIEAARAGEAGKGFAVVASEVKNLAVQAAKATDQISTEINGIQAASTEVVTALDAIRESFTTVRENVVLTASAVEQQTAVAQSMSANMQGAAEAVSTVSVNISEISSAVSQVSQAMAKTKRAAEVLVR